MQTFSNDIPRINKQILYDPQCDLKSNNKNKNSLDITSNILVLTNYFTYLVKVRFLACMLAYVANGHSKTEIQI